MKRLLLSVFLVQPVMQASLGEALWAKLLQFYYQDRESPYRGCTARVNDGASLCKAERSFVTRRLQEHVKPALETVFGMPLTQAQVPTIAIAGSGGGYRAMVSLAGFLQGLDQCGLLEASMYVAGVSGSTWCIFPWLAARSTLSDFKHQVTSAAQHGILTLSHIQDMDDLIAALTKKWAFHQPLSIIDFYGILLGHVLLAPCGVKKHDIHLAQHIARRVAVGKVPMPLGTALGSDGAQKYRWFEVSPFEVGSPELRAYIPTWALGRSFEAGVSTDYPPEQSLGYLLGIFGSAFAEYGYSQALDTLFTKMLREKYSYALSKIVQGLTADLQHHEVGGGKVRNFMYKYKGSPLAHAQKLNLIDAGIDTDEAANIGANIPLVPLLRQGRNVNVIIVMDASSNTQGAPELAKAVRYAQELGYTLPAINYEQASNSIISVWRDPNPSVPTIVYMPLIKNNDYSSSFDPREHTQSGHLETLNDDYTKEQVDRLSGLMAFNVQQSRDLLVQTLHAVVDIKHA